MKYLVAIQARCNSMRLPNKILMELYNKPVLQRVIERVCKSKYIDETVVITSFNKEDIKTVNFVSSLGYRVFAGSSEDVLDRYYQSTKLIEPEYVIRITADCPVFDSRLLDMAIEQMEEDSDYMGALTETLADGLDLEIIKFSALKKAWEMADLASQREHVTLFIKNNKELFKLQDFICPYGNLNAERWTIDQQEDYMFLTEIYNHFKDEDFYTRDIIKFLDDNKEIRELNSQYLRNEGLMKSLKNDHII